MTKVLLSISFVTLLFADSSFYKENLEGLGFCSANFLILSTSKNTTTKEAYKQAGKLAFLFGELYYKEVYKKNATARDMSILRTTYLNRIKQEYKNFKVLSNTTYEKIGMCESFARLVLENPAKIELALKQSQTNVVTKRRVLETLAFTNMNVSNLHKEEIFSIYKKWVESRPTHNKKIKLLPINIKLHK